MISISHWGMFPAWGSMPLSTLQAAYDLGVVRFFRDWDAEIDRRFPDGITPVETPFLKMLRRK